MAKSFTVDVLVCGAGAAGLTMAIELARRGVSFLLIEKIAHPFHGSRGKGIQPRTQEIFEDLGVLDKVVAAGGIYPMMRIYGADSSYIEKDFGPRPEPTVSEPFFIPLMIPQFKTEQILRDRLAEFGAAVEFGSELIGFEQDDDGVNVRLSRHSGDETLRVQYLVGADGGRSFVRHALALDFPGKTLQQRAMVADVALTGLDESWWHQFGHADMQRMLSICPLRGTNLFQLQAPVPQEGEIDLSVEGLQKLVADRTGRDDIRLSAVSWASVFQMNARLAERYRKGRVFLTGDAAHIHPPTGGQGLNTSLQDAYNLAWKLAAVLRGANANLLDSYEDERRPVAEDVLGLSTRLLDDSKRGEVRRGRSEHQLDIGYSDSQLNLKNTALTAKVAPGARAPDAKLLGAAGQPVRLFELLRGTHWTLLIAGETRFAPRKGLHIHQIGAQGELRDTSNHMQDAYGLADGDCVLIRPDGYIAAVMHLDACGAEQLTAYFDRLGLREVGGAGV